MKAVITLPQYDETTNYLFAFSRKIIKVANENGWDMIELKRPRLRRKEFVNILRKKDPSFVCFNAHGDASTIYGDKVGNTAEFLIKHNRNHELLNDRLVYARSCWTAKELGKAYEGGAGCFIGHNHPFVFWIDDNRSANPITDKTAHLFLDPTNLLVESILKGNSAQDSAEKFVNNSVKNMQRVLKNKKEPGALDNLRALWRNIKSLELSGDSSMALE